MNALGTVLFAIFFLVAQKSTQTSVHQKCSVQDKLKILKDFFGGYLLHSENNLPYRRVAFAARLSNHMMDVASNVVIKFDNVITNQGNWYNNVTGTFTAPLPGTYLFAWNALISGGAKAHVHLYVNNKDTWRSYAHEPGQVYEPTSATVVLQLKAGDAVQLRTAHSDGNYLHGDGYSGFTGCLLYK